MSEEATEANSSPKRKRKLIILALPLLLIVILGAGGGAYFYFFRASAGTEKGKNGRSAKDKKKSSKAAAEEEETESADHGGENAEGGEKKAKNEKGGGEENHSSNPSLQSALPEDADVKKVIELQPFIVNLSDTDQVRYLRLTVSLGVGEGEGGKDEKPDVLFITRVRNAMLAVLSVKKSEEILSVEGKVKLRKELLEAAQAASEEPRAEAIYITDFIVQL